MHAVRILNERERMYKRSALILVHLLIQTATEVLGETT